MKILFKSIVLISCILKIAYSGATLDDRGQMNKHVNHKKEYQKLKQSQNQDPLVVHVIPHSHDDVGWLTTVEDYFYGSNAQTNFADVQFTISTVIQALTWNPERKFVQVEMGFFTLWWYEQTDEVKSQVLKLIENGQFQIINGGWSQNDEACTYYENIIENMFVGQRFLLNELNYVPSIGWSIDPFGHSAKQSALFQQMGFNGWWFARADYQDKEKRLEDQSMEWIWIPEQADGQQYPIYCSLNYHHYSAPPEYCFDEFCSGTEPVKDNPLRQGYNVKERAQGLVDYFQSMSVHYKTNQLLHTFGDDFQYTNAEMYYKNLDRLIKYINENPDQFDNMQIKYSTPQEYLDAISQIGVTLPKVTYDFFPYADNEDSFWTGYFTSRVAGKGGIRQYGKMFQNVRTYLGLLKYHDTSSFVEKNQEEVEIGVRLMEQTIGILQHHDAVTGTEKQFVAYDYMYKLSNATDYLQDLLYSVVDEQLSTLTDIPSKDWEFKTYNWNNTAIENSVVYDTLGGGQNVLMTVYNPTLTRDQIVRTKVPFAKFDVIEVSSGKTLDAEVVCSSDGMLELDECEVYFKANLQGYNLNVFYLKYNSSPKQTTLLKGQSITSDEGQEFQLTENKKVKFFRSSDHIEYSHRQSSDEEFTLESFTMTYQKYDSYQGSGQKSGAYIFRPNKATSDGSEPYSEFEKKYLYKGNIVSLARLESPQVNAYVLFQNLSADYDKVLEVQTFVKSINIQDGQGKEIVLLLEIDSIQNEQLFYTDSSGLELIERKLNYRPTYDYDVTQQVSGNYYPINAMLQIRDSKDNNKRASVLNDRSQGGTSLKDGQLELMIHRRCLYDDGRGVGEALNETNTFDNFGLEQRMRHWVVFGSEEADNQLPRSVQFDHDLATISFFTKQTIDFDSATVNYNSYPLTDTLEANTKLYLRYYGAQSNAFLLRLNNMNDYENSTFKSTFGTIDETTLTANQLLKTWNENKINWKWEGKTEENKKQEQNEEHIDLDKMETESRRNLENNEILVGNVIKSLDLKPLQIRTFNITPSA